MNEEFFCYTLPMLVLAVMVAYDNISTEIKLCRLKERIEELERMEGQT